MDSSQSLEKLKQVLMGFLSEIEDNFRNSSEIDKYRDDSSKYGKERFKSFFVKKAALHIVCKYILLRIEEDKGHINGKLNAEGIERWRAMSKNLKNDYMLLFQLACDDGRRAGTLREIFTDISYDSFMPRLTKTFSATEKDNYLEPLKDYDFGKLDKRSLEYIIEEIYPPEERRNLEGFYEPSAAINELVRRAGLGFGGGDDGK